VNTVARFKMKNVLDMCIRKPDCYILMKVLLHSTAWSHVIISPIIILFFTYRFKLPACTARFPTIQLFPNIASLCHLVDL